MSAEATTAARGNHGEYLWQMYTKIPNRGNAEMFIELAYEAKALKDRLLRRGDVCTSDIISCIFPGILSLGHFYIEDLTRWEDAAAKQNVGKFLKDINSLLYPKLSPEVKAELLLLESIIYTALGEPAESHKCDAAYEMLCQNNKRIARMLSDILNVEAEKFTATFAHPANVSILHQKAQRLTGLDDQMAEKHFRDDIEYQSCADRREDSAEALRKSLMDFEAQDEKEERARFP
jgi:hypothetical protein